MSEHARGLPAAGPTGLAAVGAALARSGRAVVWYLEGMLGADAYRRYLEHHAATHSGHEPLTERQFWRDKMDDEDRNPQGRCC